MEFHRTVKLCRRTVQFCLARGSFYDKISVSLVGWALVTIPMAVRWLLPYSVKTWLWHTRCSGKSSRIWF